jgi:hypothetical protein
MSLERSESVATEEDRRRQKTSNGRSQRHDKRHGLFARRCKETNGWSHIVNHNDLGHFLIQLERGLANKQGDRVEDA